MKLIDPTHPFFAPLWRRVAVTGLCLGWGVVEFATGAPFWGVLFGGVGLVCLYSLLIAYPGSRPSPEPGDRPGKGPNP
jgi:hypothetical protein